MSEMMLCHNVLPRTAIYKSCAPTTPRFDSSMGSSTCSHPIGMVPQLRKAIKLAKTVEGLRPLTPLSAYTNQINELIREGCIIQLLATKEWHCFLINSLSY